MRVQKKRDVIGRQPAAWLGHQRRERMGSDQIVEDVDPVFLEHLGQVHWSCPAFADIVAASLRRDVGAGQALPETEKARRSGALFSLFRSAYFDFLKLMPMRATIDPAARRRDTGPKYCKKSIFTLTRY